MVARLLSTSPRLAVDIGAHSGTYTRALQARFPELEIHLFEPAASNVERLRARHGDQPSIVINPHAISDRIGDAVLFSDRRGSGLASLHRRRLGHWNISFDEEERVATVRFDDYWNGVLQRREIDILKMDIEGHELVALGAFGGALQATRVLQFEFGSTNIDSRTYFKDLFELLSDSGFDVHRITPLGLERIRQYREEDEFFFTTNYLAANRRGR